LLRSVRHGRATQHLTLVVTPRLDQLVLGIPLPNGVGSLELTNSASQTDHLPNQDWSRGPDSIEMFLPQIRTPAGGGGPIKDKKYPIQE
jgi:hypothetical protein